MFRWTAVLVYGIRQALVAVMMLATLASTFGLHAHSVEIGLTHASETEAQVTPAHDHACATHFATLFGGELMGADSAAGGLDSDLDSDGCGHCQISASILPTTCRSIEIAGSMSLLDLPADVPLRAGMTYQPEPPPIRS